MSDGNFINPDDFGMFELDPSEVAFQITFFAGFDDAPVKMKSLADRVICHFRTKYDDCSLQRPGNNSGFGMGQKRHFFRRECTTTRTINTVKFHLKINRSCRQREGADLSTFSPLRQQTGSAECGD